MSTLAEISLMELVCRKRSPSFWFQVYVIDVWKKNNENLISDQNVVDQNSIRIKSYLIIVLHEDGVDKKSWSLISDRKIDNTSFCFIIRYSVENFSFF